MSLESEQTYPFPPEPDHTLLLYFQAAPMPALLHILILCGHGEESFRFRVQMFPSLLLSPALSKIPEVFLFQKKKFFGSQSEWFPRHLIT